MRPASWPERLAAYVTAVREQPWCWGTHDCCSFARGAVLAVGGPDLGVDWGSSYVDEDGARAAIRMLGRDLEAAMEAVCAAAGLEEVDPALAQRGDLVVLRDRMLVGVAPAAAVCMGRNAFAATLRGIVAVPMTSACRAWAVT